MMVHLPKLAGECAAVTSAPPPFFSSGVSMANTDSSAKADYSKLVAGSSAGGSAATLGVVAVWFLNAHMNPPMPPEIAAAAVAAFTWLVGNIAVFLKVETSKLEGN